MTTSSFSDEHGMPNRLWVDLQTQHAYFVKPEPYVETVEYGPTADFNNHYEDLMKAALLREQDAATRMRDLFVGKVKSMREEWLRREAAHLEGHGTCPAANKLNEHWQAAEKIITALQSLTLDNGETSERKQ